MYLETIKQTLAPRLENLLKNQSPEKQNSLIESFEKHMIVLAQYIEKNEDKLQKLDIDFFVGFHKLLYPVDFQIRAEGNDSVVHITHPGDFRKHHLARYKCDFSKVEDVEKDFKSLLCTFNAIEKPTREDIMRLYFEFGKVHPFSDSNGTISIIICDLLCVKYGYRPINILKIRFKDKDFGFRLVSILDEDNSFQSLTKILRMIDEF